MLEIDGLVRSYGPVRALDGMTFAVEPGSVTGFLGPNGAGKTTTMRAVFGLVALDAGVVRWDDRPNNRGIITGKAYAWASSTRAHSAPAAANTRAGPRLHPPTAVLAMPTLYAIEAAPRWAVVLSMAMTAASVVLVANVAAKIYERSVMRTARKIGWREASRARQGIEPATAGRQVV